MGRKATAIQKAAARKLKLRTTKTVRGKLIPLDAETLKKRTAAAKLKVAKKKVAAKKKATSKRIIKVSGDRSADSRVAAKKAGQRTAKKYAKIKYKKKDPKTGKLKVVTVRRKNATSRMVKGKRVYITPTSGNKYTERRSDRSDKGEYI